MEQARKQSLAEEHAHKSKIFTALHERRTTRPIILTPQSNTLLLAFPNLRVSNLFQSEGPVGEIREAQLRAAATLFAKTFSSAPYFDDWTLESAFHLVFSKFLEKHGAQIVLVEDQNELVGVSGTFIVTSFMEELREKGNKEALRRIVDCLERAGISPIAVSYLDLIAVLVDKRNHGLGQSLMQSWECQARAEGLSAIMFRTATPAMMHLAEKLGFEIMFDDSHSGREDVDGRLTFRRYFMKKL